MHQCHQDHANDSLIDDIPTFDRNPELNLILKLENIASVTK